MLTKMKGKIRLWWWPTLLLCAVHTTWGFEEEKCIKDEEEVYPKKYFQYLENEKSLTINLDTSNRITHQLSTHIFYIYVKEVLGYPKVNITFNEDHFQIESAIERLSDYVDRNKTIPEATINLEVWASPDYDTFAKDLVKECGSVGPPGRFGWFIPKTLSGPVRRYYGPAAWTNSIQEVHWTLFLDRQLVSFFNVERDVLDRIEREIFRMDQSKYICNNSTLCRNSMYTPKQCRNQTCAVLLAPEFNSTSFLIDQIQETGLLIKVLWLGDHLQAVIEHLKERYGSDNRRSLLFFYWYPSEIVLQEENYINVQFKNNEFYNFTHEKTVGYKYEMHRLVKLAWEKVAKNAEPLYLGLRHFKLDEKDYDFLLRRYVEVKGNVKDARRNVTDVRRIACEWMQQNKEVWNNWKGYNTKQKIYIGGIFPMMATSYNGKGIAAAALKATKAINSNDSLLKDYELRLIISDGNCQPDAVMKNFIDFIADGEYYKKMVGVLGPACSETVEPIAGVSKHYRVLIVSYSAEGASFSDRLKYPYFFRTIGENQHYKHVYMSLFKRFGWKRVAALTEDGQKYTEYISLMSDELEKNGIKFIANKKFPREKSNEDMKYYLADLKSKRARIIIADVVDSVARTVMCEAYKQDMTAVQGYVWFLPVWLDNRWYDTDYYNAKLKEVINCTTKEMKEAITGYFAMTHTYYADNDSMMQEGITVGKWREQNSVNSSNYAGFAYDAVWTYAFALNNLSKTDPEAMSNLHTEVTTNKLVRLVEATDFQGLSGRIKFRGGPSRFSIISIVQWYDDTLNTIGYFHPNLTNDKPEILGGNLQLNDTAFKWFTPDGRVPADGTLPPPSCAVEGLARAFDVECQTAVIILNVIVAGVLLLGVVGVCFYMKRKYDRKVQKTKNYMKALGIPFDPRHCSDLDKWEIHRESVVINRKLGEGAFGTVYGGEANLRESDTIWTAVAVKTLKMGSTAEEKLDFLSEAEAMKRFDHKNIVKLLGVCTKDEPVYTIMEFMLYGDLKNYLLARRHLVKSKNVDESEEVSSKRLTNMAMDVARGLSYLAEMKFVHRDIASRNCLINAQRTVKIGDFGMTRAMFDNDYYKFTRRGMLPVRWMSPESLALGVFTPASDVWSFGVLLYEIITFGSFPFQGKSNAQVLELVKEGHVLDIPKGVKPQLVGLIKSCWKQESKERPTASQMVEFFANNPRLLSPCLDGPISSVQIGDSDQLDIGRKCNESSKVSPSKSANGSAFRTQNSMFEDEREPDNIPMEVCCPKEPLLGQGKSSSSNLLSRLVVGSSRRESEDDDEYLNQNVSDIRQDNTNV
ncbi:unnamed protein product [Phaedon cochleariae]|uniref:Gamma-aminobutyric acid type B receptor subunit 2 n=1 Tax=Phaedon cochleariae TaxID=80249 RepID=A0A9P0DD09_PHACE|nr:unnamed protein product [Phaedon cochleariae]